MVKERVKMGADNPDNYYMNAQISGQFEYKIVGKRNSIDYLNSELETTTVVGVRQAIYSVIQSQIEQIMLATVRDDYAFKVLDPAIAPDPDDTAFPNRPIFGFVGLVLGLAFAVVIAAFLYNRRLTAASD